MSYLFDNLADYSKTPTAGLIPAVTSGLTTYALFGRTLAASLANYANSAAPLTVSVAPTVNAVSGLVTTSPGELVTPDIPTAGSETIYLVMSVNPSSWTSFESFDFGCVPVNTTTGTMIASSNATIGLQANIGLTISGTNASRVASITAGGNALISGDTATQAVISTPQMYMLKLDIGNLLITWQNLSQTASSWKNTIPLTAGTVRPANASPYAMLAAGPSLSALNASNTYHAYVHYSRATTSAEDALVSAQLRKIMATRGVTV